MSVFCFAGKFSEIADLTSSTGCLNCIPDSYSLPDSNTVEECSCNVGFVKQQTDATGIFLCADINECAVVPNICNLASCMNTVGSYICLASKNESVPTCSELTPNSCDTTGGDTVFIRMPPSSTHFQFSVRFSSITVQADWKGLYLATLCPPSVTLGFETGYVLNSDLSVFCTFQFKYIPSPATIVPLIVPLQGGNITVTMNGYGEYLGVRSCRFFFGGEMGREFMLFKETTNVSTTAPASNSEETVSVSILCSGMDDLFDLSVYLEYVGPSFAIVSNGSLCIRFLQCQLFISLINPPRVIDGPEDLEFSVLGLDNIGAARKSSSANIQV